MNSIPQGNLYERVGNLKKVDDAGKELGIGICTVCNLFRGQIRSLTANEDSVLKFLRLIRMRYPVEKEKQRLSPPLSTVLSRSLRRVAPQHCPVLLHLSIGQNFG
jgi:hypothetical protein